MTDNDIYCTIRHLKKMIRTQDAEIEKLKDRIRELEFDAIISNSLGYGDLRCRIEEMERKLSNDR